MRKWLADLVEIDLYRQYYVEEVVVVVEI